MEKSYKYELFTKMIRDFTENEIKPNAAEVDETEHFPYDNVKKMAEAGFSE